MSEQPVRVEILAKELGISTAEVLQQADDEIGRVVDRDGIDAARGLTTYQGRNPVTISAPLADRLRSKGESR